MTSPNFGDGKAGNKYKYGGKGRIPDFDPDAETEVCWAWWALCRGDRVGTFDRFPRWSYRELEQVVSGR